MDDIIRGLKDLITGDKDEQTNEAVPPGQNVLSSDQDPYGDPGQNVLSSDQDPYGDPGQNVRSSDEDPYGDPGARR